MKKEFTVCSLPTNLFIDMEYLKDVYNMDGIEEGHEEASLITKMIMVKEYYKNSRNKIFSLQKGNATWADMRTIGFFIINLDSITTSLLELVVPNEKLKGFIIGKGGSNINSLKDDINDKLGGVHIKQISIK